MKTWTKYTVSVALAGAMALAAATPSEAWHGRNAAAIGFGVGAIAGAAVASSAYNGGYYGYYNEPAYAPGYAYDSYGYDSYAYAPGYSSYGYSYEPSYSGYGYDNSYAYSPGYRFEGAYNSNNNGPWHERSLQGRDW